MVAALVATIFDVQIMSSMDLVCIPKMVVGHHKGRICKKRDLVLTVLAIISGVLMVAATLDA